MKILPSLLACIAGFLAAPGTVAAAEDAATAAAAAPAAAAPAAAAPAQPAAAADVDWQTDFMRSCLHAQKQNRHIFVLFTGSDWCIWCKRLDKEILSQPAFASYARDNLVAVKLDFPRSIDLPVSLKQQNDRLAQRYQIQGYPTVVVLGPDGQEVGRFGYMPGGSMAFVAELRKVCEAPTAIPSASR